MQKVFITLLFFWTLNTFSHLAVLGMSEIGKQELQSWTAQLKSYQNLWAISCLAVDFNYSINSFWHSSYQNQFHMPVLALGQDTSLQLIKAYVPWSEMVFLVDLTWEHYWFFTIIEKRMCIYIKIFFAKKEYQITPGYFICYTSLFTFEVM